MACVIRLIAISPFLCCVAFSGLINASSDTQQPVYWAVLNSAMASRGPDADDAFALLGSIDDRKARELLEVTLRGVNGDAIEYAARGLSADQCRQYLSELRRAVLDPAIEPKLGVLAALARAGTVEAAEVLAQVANQGAQPAAGVAFGLLEHMGSPAETVLKKEATSGPTAWTRETAASILDRIGARGTVAVFRADIHDSDEKVRIAGALGLSHQGIPEGKTILESAVSRNVPSYALDALVALANLGQAEALRTIEQTLNGPDESTKGALVWAIARSGSTSLKALAYRLGLEKKPEFLAMLAEKLLQPGDVHDLKVLKEALVDCNQAVGMIAAERLVGARLGELAENAIVCGLSSTDAQARQLAVDLALQDSRLWPALADRLEDPDPVLQLAALTAIKRLGAGGRFEQVEELLTSHSRQVSLAAAKTLAALDPIKAHAVFEQALTSQLEYVRIFSAAMLLKLDRSG
jgi:HEAT repeat protein